MIADEAWNRVETSQLARTTVSMAWRLAASPDRCHEARSTSAAAPCDALLMSFERPLAGIRILTFENFGAGPFGSMYLADLGAEVVKIEARAQGGDATRSMGPCFLGPP